MTKTNKIKEEIMDSFDKFIGDAPEIIEGYENKLCIMCGQPFNKSKQTEEFKKLLSQSIDKVLEERDKFWQKQEMGASHDCYKHCETARVKGFKAGKEEMQETLYPKPSKEKLKSKRP